MKNHVLFLRGFYFPNFVHFACCFVTFWVIYFLFSPLFLLIIYYSLIHMIRYIVPYYKLSIEEYNRRVGKGGIGAISLIGFCSSYLFNQHQILLALGQLVINLFAKVDMKRLILVLVSSTIPLKPI